ncbi:MAG: hypothetical protein KAI88_00780, partial [Nitrosomonadaceae bacterium]|nr:hypothetical protein [Nitrosomonadaceae bacterium]
MKKFNGVYKLSAAVTAGILVGQSTAANAAANLGGLTTNLTTSSSSLPTLVTSIAYICGLGLAVAGIFKLKQHVDNPSQTPMKDGVMRLGAGGALLALPFIANAMMVSIDNANAANTVTVGLAAAP